jgi:enamine deaminase RidA (YjgF/YER057c/UK114 family)
LGDGYREIVGSVYPAMTLVQVAALLEDGARVEIEATAVLPGSTSPGSTEKRAEP